MDPLNPKILGVSGSPAGVTTPPVFVDGFGVRYHTFDPESAEPDDPVEVLAFDRSLVDTPEFAPTLGVRVARLASVRHTLFARVRRLDRPAENSLLLVSDRVPGWRLADVLDVAERERLTFDISAVLSLLRQLIPTVSLFARHQRELAVGTIGPEHLILTPQGRLVIAEYVLGSALEKLPLSREELWHRYRVTATGGATKIWPRSDALGIGIVVLSVLYGRRLRQNEFPEALENLVENAQETSGGMVRPLSPKLSGWLGRALQLEPRTGFQSPQDAQVAFEEMLASERAYVTTPALLEAFITRFMEVIGPKPKPAPPPPLTEAEDQEEDHAIEQAIASISSTPRAVPPPPAFPPPSPYSTLSAPPGAPAAQSPASPPSSPTSPASLRQPSPSPASPAPSPARSPTSPTPSPISPPLISFEDVVPEPEPAPVEEESARVRFERAVGGWPRLFAALLGIVLVGGAIFWLSRGPSDTLVGDGELVVQSRPPGATVTLDDKDLGTTPVTVRLAPGVYTLKVQLGKAEPRVIAIQIRAGVQTVQYLELQNAR